MAHAIEAAQYLISETDSSRLAACANEVTFVGRSNVGKSSLINSLCRKDIAKVSGTPGRTRTINVYAVSHDRWIVDLPGYGYASGPKSETKGWTAMIEGYLKGRSSLRMIFTLIDAKVGPTKLDVAMIDWLREVGLPYRVVATKCDQVKAAKTFAQRRGIAQALGLESNQISWVSALKGVGMPELRGEVSSLLGY